MNFHPAQMTIIYLYPTHTCLRIKLSQTVHDYFHT